MFLNRPSCTAHRWNLYPDSPYRTFLFPHFQTTVKAHAEAERRRRVWEETAAAERYARERSARLQAAIQSEESERARRLAALSAIHDESVSERWAAISGTVACVCVSVRKCQNIHSHRHRQYRNILSIFIYFSSKTILPPEFRSSVSDNITMFSKTRVKNSWSFRHFLFLFTL